MSVKNLSGPQLLVGLSNESHLISGLVIIQSYISEQGKQGTGVLHKNHDATTKDSNSRIRSPVIFRFEPTEVS